MTRCPAPSSPVEVCQVCSSPQPGRSAFAQDIQFEHDLLHPAGITPQDQQVGAAPPQPVFPFHSPAVDDSLQEGLQQQLRPGFLVVEPLQPVFGMLAEEVLNPASSSVASRPRIIRRAPSPAPHRSPPLTIPTGVDAAIAPGAVQNAATPAGGGSSGGGGRTKYFFARSAATGYRVRCGARDRDSNDRPD